MQTEFASRLVIPLSTHHYVTYRAACKVVIVFKHYVIKVYRRMEIKLH
jgi:hypothetical protein